MEDKIADVLTVILMIGIYIGLPVLLYVLIFKAYKNRKKGKVKVRKNKWFSVPLLIVNAAPAFMITLHEQGGIRMNEELWYCVMSICFVLTMIATVIECGVRGIGIGLVRFLAGTSLGLVAGGSVILFFGLLLVSGVIIQAAGSKSRSITIIVNSRPVQLTPGSRSDLYQDPSGNTYRRMENGTVLRDRDGESYMIVDEDG